MMWRSISQRKREEGQVAGWGAPPPSEGEGEKKEEERNISFVWPAEKEKPKGPRTGRGVSETLLFFSGGEEKPPPPPFQKGRRNCRRLRGERLKGKKVFFLKLSYQCQREKRKKKKKEKRILLQADSPGEGRGETD